MSILLDTQVSIRHKTPLKKILINAYRKDVVKMVCSTVKEGQECFFMSKKGCGFNGGSCHIIIEACEGCQKAAEYPTGKYCTVSPDPAAKWRMGACNMATHIQASAKKDAAKVNPLKASKRASH